jgi:hypothetical protein
MMKSTSRTASALSAALAFGLLGGCAQTAPASAPTSTAGTGTQRPTSAQKQEFLRTHYYDHVNQVWVVKGGSVDTAAPPPDVKSRAQVKAERDDFLSKNRWDNVNSRWVPVAGPPRELSTLPREQVKQETEQFLRNYTYDEMTDTWIPK